MEYAFILQSFTFCEDCQMPVNKKALTFGKCDSCREIRRLISEGKITVH